LALHQRGKPMRARDFMPQSQVDVPPCQSDLMQLKKDLANFVRSAVPAKENCIAANTSQANPAFHWISH